MFKSLDGKTVENNISGIEIMNDKGDIVVQGLDIDSVVNDGDVTYIKVDVE